MLCSPVHNDISPSQDGFLIIQHGLLSNTNDFPCYRMICKIDKTISPWNSIDSSQVPLGLFVPLYSRIVEEKISAPWYSMVCSLIPNGLFSDTIYFFLPIVQNDLPARENDCSRVHCGQLTDTIWFALRSRMICSLIQHGLLSDPAWFAL
jgi:hypothetical protein